nr:uncharacterized protein LOC128685432 [Cherax quadricarinatus]
MVGTWAASEGMPAPRGTLQPQQSVAQLSSWSVPFTIPALLLYPPPFLPYSSFGTALSASSLASGQTERFLIEGGSSMEAVKTVNQTTVVKVYTDDWDDMETCPYWCKKENGAIHCCPEEGTHSGKCPKPKEVCVIKNVDENQPTDNCIADDTCLETHKCCYDRCLGFRVCTPADPDS